MNPRAPTPEFAVQQAIRMKRERFKLSKRELSRRCGLSSSYVVALESGRLQPSLRAFAKLAVELRFTPLEMHLIILAEAGVQEEPQ